MCKSSALKTTKILLREIKEYLNYHRYISCLGIKVLNITKMPILSKFIYRLIDLLTFVIEIKLTLKFKWGFPGGSDGKESACNVGDLG